MNCINYDNLEKATQFYESKGYQRIEVPWWVTSDIANITRPTSVPESSNYKLSVNGKCLVASGEQAFLYLANKGQLPPGKYQTITPCFRNEEYDAYHSKQFMKLELIELLDASTQLKVAATADIAVECFNQLSGLDSFLSHATFVSDPISSPNTEQLDVSINVSGKLVELGSYGARQTSFASWIYGTGLAEPRFSKILKEIKSFY